jgi:glycosyltransferase involved in cell wall biosynthesis
MRILQVHNVYQQAGGEDRVVAAEQALLSANGHTVFQYTVHNDAVKKMAAVELGCKTVWNQEAYGSIRRLIVEQSIELVHVHNTLPLVSPAVYYAAAAQQTPVVQTLHNYRLLCPAATFYRQGKICELCLGKAIKYPAVMHRCYRGSLAASAAVSAMLAAHHFAGTYQRKIHTYIALTKFARAKFAEGGLPPERMVVKPNFLAEDPGAGGGHGGYALFAGRLTEEKGLATLLDAWAAGAKSIPLKIAGDGPLQAFVRARAAALPGVEYLGACEHARVIELLQDAAFLVFPSRWYEGMPMVVLEATACGTPVVAFGIGSMNDLIVDGLNGIKLAADDGSALARFLENSGELTEKMAALRRGARMHFEQNFSAKVNYGLLLEIYRRALNQPRSIS